MENLGTKNEQAIARIQRAGIMAP
ncbi:hypothetical protein LCGC14_2866330, partial [marine sediment metagenome]